MPQPLPASSLTPHRARGFTLVEMAMVLLILSLLASGLVSGLSSHMARRQEQATDAALEETRDALLGFLVRKGYFPCPARSGMDGTEDRNGSSGTCTRSRGLLPWATLGVSGLDGWDRRIHYAVHSSFSTSLSASWTALNGTASGTLSIQTRNPDGSEQSLTSTDGKAVVLFLSHGPNGLGATDARGSTLPMPPNGSDEEQNALSTSTRIYSRSLSLNPDTPGGAFDDRVSWISPNLIALRLIQAGKEP
ncbi:MAG: type II secretion system GspH family protein [Rhodocyclales bacterium]|nr:type II secretion system GspH family protein [Rhodocyclales bacterium]